MPILSWSVSECDALRRTACAPRTAYTTLALCVPLPWGAVRVAPHGPSYQPVHSTDPYRWDHLLSYLNGRTTRPPEVLDPVRPHAVVHSSCLAGYTSWGCHPPLPMRTGVNPSQPHHVGSATPRRSRPRTNLLRSTHLGPASSTSGGASERGYDRRSRHHPYRATRPYSARDESLS